jgi:hypothetical protein
MKLAPHDVPVIARQQHGLARANHHRLGAIKGADLHAARDHVVISHDLLGIGQIELEIGHLHRRRDAPWRGELGVEKHPAGHADRAQHLP